MAMGEAMAAGAVPIATAQRGMRHFRHSFDLDDPAATGLAVPRSFRVDDDLLTGAVHAGMRQLLDLMRTEPARFEQIRARAVEVGRGFTWAEVARRFLAIFQACSVGIAPPAVRLADPVPLPDAGAGSVEPAGDGLRVRWSAPDAARIEVVAGAEVHVLDAAEDGSFAGTVPAHTGAAVLVTGHDGRSAWAELSSR